MVSGNLLHHESTDTDHGQTRDNTQPGFDSKENDSRDRNRLETALKSLLADCGASSVSHLK